MAQSEKKNKPMKKTNGYKFLSSCDCLPSSSVRDARFKFIPPYRNSLYRPLTSRFSLSTRSTMFRHFNRRERRVNSRPVYFDLLVVFECRGMTRRQAKWEGKRTSNFWENGGGRTSTDDGRKRFIRRVDRVASFPCCATIKKVEERIKYHRLTFFSLCCCGWAVNEPTVYGWISKQIFTRYDPNDGPKTINRSLTVKRMRLDFLVLSWLGNILKKGGGSHWVKVIVFIEDKVSLWSWTHLQKCSNARLVRLPLRFWSLISFFLLLPCQRISQQTERERRD